MNWFIKLMVDKGAKALDGKKMYIIGTAFILKGLVGLIGHYWPDTGLIGADVNDSVENIMWGLGVFAGKSAIVKSGPDCGKGAEQ